MNHSERLIKKSLEEKSKIKHKFDVAVDTALSFQKYGFDPFFKKYEDKITLTWEMSNRDPVFNDFFNKLTELEPLFFKISSSFKKDLTNAFFAKFQRFFSKSELYVDVNRINWILIYSQFKGFDFIKEESYSLDDFILIKKLDLDYVKSISDINLKNPKLYKDFDQMLKIEDPYLYYKLNPKKVS